MERRAHHAWFSVKDIYRSLVVEFSRSGSSFHTHGHTNIYHSIVDNSQGCVVQQTTTILNTTHKCHRTTGCVHTRERVASFGGLYKNYGAPRAGVENPRSEQLPAIATPHANGHHLASDSARYARQPAEALGRRERAPTRGRHRKHKGWFDSNLTNTPASSMTYVSKLWCVLQSYIMYLQLSIIL